MGIDMGMMAASQLGSNLLGRTQGGKAWNAAKDEMAGIANNKAASAVDRAAALLAQVHLEGVEVVVEGGAGELAGEGIKHLTGIGTKADGKTSR